MKRKIIAGAAFALLMTSCAKDYNCQCTYTNVDEPYDSYVTDSDLRNTPKEAEKNCDYLSGTSYSGSLTYEKTCVLYPK